jgi:hypothetical protein
VSDELGRIELVGYRDALGRFAAYEARTEAVQRDTLRRAVQMLTAAIRAAGPRSERGGPHAVDGIVFRTRITGRGVVEASIQATGPKRHLIPMIRFGTRPHEIRPRRAGGVLRFRWAAGGNGSGVYFFRRVRHPGTRPNDFVMRTWTRMQSSVFADLRGIARQVFQAVGG